MSVLAGASIVSISMFGWRSLKASISSGRRSPPSLVASWNDHHRIVVGPRGTVAAAARSGPPPAAAPQPAEAAAAVRPALAARKRRRLNGNGNGNGDGNG